MVLVLGVCLYEERACQLQTFTNTPVGTVEVKGPCRLYSRGRLSYVAFLVRLEQQ